MIKPVKAKYLLVVDQNLVVLLSDVERCSICPLSNDLALPWWLWASKVEEGVRDVLQLYSCHKHSTKTQNQSGSFRSSQILKGCRSLLEISLRSSLNYKSSWKTGCVIHDCCSSVFLQPGRDKQTELWTHPWDEDLLQGADIPQPGKIIYLLWWSDEPAIIYQWGAIFQNIIIY